MKKSMIKVMLLFAFILAVLPAASASAQKYPIPNGIGFYEDITGSGKLVVTAIGGGGHPEAPGTVWWRLIIVGPNGENLYNSEYGSTTLYNLPYGTYRVYYQTNGWTSLQYYYAAFE